MGFKSFTKRPPPPGTPEPTKTTSKKGPQAKGSPSVDRSMCGDYKSNLGIGAAKPSASKK